MNRHVELIKEVQDEFGISLKDTFLDKVDDPILILRFMVNTAMNWDHKEYDCWEIGKKLQMKYQIPYKTELEVSAGLWYLIYEGKI